MSQKVVEIGFRFIATIVELGNLIADGADSLFDLVGLVLLSLAHQLSHRLGKRIALLLQRLDLRNSRTTRFVKP